MRNFICVTSFALAACAISTLANMHAINHPVAQLHINIVLAIE
jgi:hypothetical protein